MSDNKEHTMQGGVDWELRTAEEKLVAAPGGGKELAQAMRLHADGVRNMMQSEIVPSFEKAIDAITEKHTVRILSDVAVRLDQITGLVEMSITISREAHATGKEALGIAKAGAARLGTVEKAVTTLKAGQSASKKQWDNIVKLLDDSKADRADLRQRIDMLSAVVDEHNRISIEHDELARKVAQLEAWRVSLERGG